MNVESKGLVVTQSIHIEAIQEIVAQTVKQITSEMLNALMSGLQEKLDFKGLAEKHISITHKTELSASDEKTQMIYQKLFIATHEHIQKHSQPLVMTFAMMNQQTGNKESAGMFLSTFVLPAVNSIIGKLEVEQPEALTTRKFGGNSTLVIKRDGKMFCIMDKVFVSSKDCEMVILGYRTD
jgi:hypothetical protein